MSYDVSLTTARGHQIFDLGNYTSNVVGAWARALGKPLSEFDKMKAADAEPYFRDAVTKMLNKPDEFERLMPENNWGDFEGTMKFLLNIYLHCRKEPEALLSISY